MTIREITFSPPITITKNTTEDVMKAVAAYTGIRAERVLSAGLNVLNEPRWNLPTHEWRVTVRKDGTGVLNIKPTMPSSRVKQLGIKHEFREVTHMLNRHDRAACLMGEQKVVGHTRTLLFKQLVYEPDTITA